MKSAQFCEKMELLQWLTGDRRQTCAMLLLRHRLSILAGKACAVLGVRLPETWLGNTV